MSTLFGVLHVGASGLAASSFGVSVASQNVSNSATGGYSRRVALLDPLGAPAYGGVRAAGATRILDTFVERRLLGARSFEGQSSARALALATLDSTFGDGPGSPANALGAFEDAASDVASRPAEPAAREVLLQRSETLASSFRQAADELSAARADVSSRIVDAVGGVNGRLHEIADLGARIVRSETAGGAAADLRDRRDRLVREVARDVPVHVIEQSDGGITLLLAGSRTLVGPKGEVHELIASPDAAGDVRVSRLTAGATEDVTGLLSSGSIAGFVEGRDGALTDAQSALDQLAHDFVTAYDSVHAAGYGLDGGTGRDLFERPAGVTGAAASMAVSSDVAGRPDRIAAAQDPASLPGDNRTALALEALSSDRSVALGGTSTASGALGALTSAGGSALQAARREADHATAVVDQVQGLRDSVSGVSTDEEMVALTRYQRAYQASLRVVQTADQMLGELLNMRR